MGLKGQIGHLSSPGCGDVVTFSGDQLDMGILLTLDVGQYSVAKGNWLGVAMVGPNDLASEFAQEVSELSAQRLLELFEDAPVFLALASAPDWRILYANKAWRSLIDRSEVVGHEVEALLPELEGQGYIERLHEAYESGRPVVRHGSPLIVRAEPGREERKYVDFIYQPVLDQRGKVTSIFATGYDATDEHRATLEAARLTEELYEMRRSILVEGLSASLSHELKQPLSASTNYLGAASVILRNSEFQKADRVMEMISAAQEQVQRAGEIINGLRALSGARLAKRENIDFLRLAQDVVNSATASGICNQVRVKLQSSEHDLQLSCDPAQIFKVLSNLVRNFCRAMKTKGGVVEISASHSDHDMIEISVTDEGPGFPGSMLENGPRIGTSTTDGLGIGLALSEALVQAHGGHLFLENYADGARVTFTLPQARNHEP